MNKPRIIIADEDINYIISLQLKFAKDFFEKVELEIITDKEYFDELFSKPQKADILIVSDDMYISSLQKHNISNIFLMMEEYEEGGTEELNICKLFKYTSIKEIFSTIVGKSADNLNIEGNAREETQIIVVTSANGGAGKTTIAMGISACLAKAYKRVLYINAGRLQCFQYMLENKAVLTLSDVYASLANPSKKLYGDIKHIIRKEIFSYIPEFKASLMSVGIKYSVYRHIALLAKESGDYDFIVIDAESTFDTEKTSLLDIADKVIIVTEQSINAVLATNALVSNINWTSSDKYAFVCNKFEKEHYNALIVPDIAAKFNVSEYVDRFEADGRLTCEELSQNNEIRKVSFLII